MAQPAGIGDVIQRFPIGEHVSGRIRTYLRPNSRTGLFVDLEPGVTGFVDGTELPLHAHDWPPIGAAMRFEVLRHDLYESVYDNPHRCQVRLWPLDRRWRKPRAHHWGFDDEQWASIQARYRIGATVTGTVDSVARGNRWYTVHFDDVWARVSWTGTPPAVGTTGRYTVSRLLDSTHRILITPETTS
ncbi:hypothetical protein FNH05_03945 [Amycolatopsis rhizosphaerae]|uniref:S1 motif domain-containing protein n=1 Tax=Amycolatopsis rhizosphaerae TaxID=2053003 RepID=A0A558DIN3_9PSEU|nr:hypothetical protein [Amycolatopsis rhizosphaerae]TVT60876.1 hypothetical protein FNH05_03945 [Amycolatopsis rhizosphaerae]